MQKIVNGFIIEADKSGYFYHRTRSWIKYDKPEVAFVWPEEEVKQIIEAASLKPEEWELKPAHLHPATYYAPIAGRVEINHPRFAAHDFKNPSIYKGGLYNSRTNKFTVSSELIAVAVHL
jgi:hypothetical protein